MEYVHLKDITEKITKGTTPSNIGDSFSDQGVMFFRSELIGRTKYVDKTKGLLYISSETHKKLKRSQICENDLLFSMAGVYLGKLSIAGKSDVPSNTNQAVALIRLKKDVCNVEYVYYYMKQNWFNELVCSYSAQAAQPNINLEQIGNLKIQLTDRLLQDKIVDILSAYDNLIENNTRRIRLLEQMAENLYKEWFVRFRFPGYEKAEFENGLPRGWNLAPLKTICEFSRGKNITSSEMVSGEVPVISAGISPSGYHNESNVKGTSITVSSSGANAGFISIHYEDIWAADCSYVSEKSTKNIYFVYETLNNIRAVVDNLQRGAAQPHVYPKDLNRIVVVVPSEKLQGLANERFKQIHQLIYKLLQQNTRLTRQRDLLLPRLMSGKLEVKE